MATITDLKRLGQVVETSKVNGQLVTETYTYSKSEVSLDYIRLQVDGLKAQKLDLEADIAEKEAVLI